MTINKAPVSGNFRRITIRAILSIVLFAVVYILLIGLAFGLTFIFGSLAIVLIVAKPMLLTIMIGIGLASMGIFILIYLLKFIFKKHTVDRSHLIEISRAEEPELFKLIDEIVNEVKTKSPKRIYLSPEVNASVFYDSSFASMFFPVKKNLQIGMGLVNAVTCTEFKAILAHEFGHFSQRTMKVGSYVYNMNQVIYNMLYDNEQYDSMIQKWSNINGYFRFFVWAANKIIQGVQWILKEVYEIVNLSYMSLLREMEFHADEVAANITGSEPLITSLLRIELADYSYNSVLEYYNNKIDSAIRTPNVYPKQRSVMNFLAMEEALPFENDLPQVSMEYLKRYNKSKLIIKDQWASHPSTEVRVNKLITLGIEMKDRDTMPASALFKNIDQLQEKVTSHLFSFVHYAHPVVLEISEVFMAEFVSEYNNKSFHKMYNNYYNNKNPSVIDLDNIQDGPVLYGADVLFCNKQVDTVYTSLSLDSDINSLKQIINGNLKVKSFDYDGIKYTPNDCSRLIRKLESELEKAREEIFHNDINIYKYFLGSIWNIVGNRILIFQQ
jgi:Zn-dependent protease with chaperone function